MTLSLQEPSEFVSGIIKTISSQYSLFGEIGYKISSQFQNTNIAYNSHSSMNGARNYKREA